MAVRKILLLSTSTIHGSEYLQYASSEIKSFLTESNVQTVLFIPYALHNHNAYFEKVKKALLKMGFKTSSIHHACNPLSAVDKAEAIFIGGGNTFRLLKELYDKNLLDIIKKRVLEDCIPYIGSSAGTNLATVNICTTNDMPIVNPPSFSALGFLPFNINPHYIDPDPNSTHMGETREERIVQYHEIPSTPPVLGLREGSLLHIIGNTIILKGNLKARLFVRGRVPKEINPGSDLSFLLSQK
uniref:dipeptidase E n=1 Tax=Clastoptera arizonana TaxID=38151 RepID=A0A1B6DYD8_9HEMI